MAQAPLRRVRPYLSRVRRFKAAARARSQALFASVGGERDRARPASRCNRASSRPHPDYHGAVTGVAASTRRPLSGPTGRLVATHRRELYDVLRRHGVTNPEIFGSAARGDDHEGSDVDMLVDFPPGTSIIDIIGVQHELEDLLGVPVDLVPRSGLKERVRARAAKDLLPL